MIVQALREASISLPRFYLDVQDDTGLTQDETGMEFANLSEARNHAMNLLPVIARDNITDAEHQEITIFVRGGGHEVFYVVRLTMEGIWVTHLEGGARH